MKKKITALVMLLCCSMIILSATSCKQTRNTFVHIRVFIESDKSEESMIKVFLEDKTGNTVNAARVICIDTHNRAALLEFDSLKCYYWTKMEIPDSGNITVKVKSNGLQQEKQLTIPHEKNLETPKLITFQDELGNSILKGEDISSEHTIDIAWQSIGSNCVYTVEIKTPTHTLYSSATNACILQIPKNTLKPNKNYRLIITAQKYFGDPLFEKFPYYSVCSMQTGGISFDTK